MSRYKDLIIEWEEKVRGIDDYLKWISDAENVSEVVGHVVDHLDLKYETDISHVVEICTEDMNEYWSKYI